MQFRAIFSFETDSQIVSTAELRVLFDSAYKA